MDRLVALGLTNSVNALHGADPLDRLGPPRGQRVFYALDALHGADTLDRADTARRSFHPLDAFYGAYALDTGSFDLCRIDLPLRDYLLLDLLLPLIEVLPVPVRQTLYLTEIVEQAVMFEELIIGHV
jgi:hypothetical protein